MDTVASTGGSATGLMAPALADLRATWARAWLVRALGWSDIRRQFSGSFLGPLWHTLNILILTTALAVLFGGALGAGHPGYLPYVGIGLVMWQFIQRVMSESCHVFVGAAEVLRNSPLPLSLQVFRLVWRNALLMAHNLVVVLVLLMFLGQAAVPHWTILPAAALELAMATGAAMLLGLAAARWRDVTQFVTNGMQLLFFVSPVFWYPRSLFPGREWLIQANPVAAFIEIMRAPLLGTAASGSSWLIALALSLGALSAALWMLAINRTRLVYWV